MIKVAFLGFIALLIIGFGQFLEQKTGGLLSHLFKLAIFCEGGSSVSASAEATSSKVTLDEGQRLKVLGVDKGLDNPTVNGKITATLGDCLKINPMCVQIGGEKSNIWMPVPKTGKQ